MPNVSQSQPQKARKKHEKSIMCYKFPLLSFNNNEKMPNFVQK